MNLKDPNRDQQQHSVTCKHAGGGIGELQFTLCPRKKKHRAMQKVRKRRCRWGAVLCYVSLWLVFLSHWKSIEALRFKRQREAKEATWEKVSTLFTPRPNDVALRDSWGSSCEGHHYSRWVHGRACFCKFKLIASKSKETGARGTEIFRDTRMDSDGAGWPAHRLLNEPNKQSVR